MKLTELMEKMTSGLKVSDSGLTAIETDVSGPRKEAISAARGHLNRLRRCLTQLKKLGADISEPGMTERSDEDEGVIGLGFSVSGVDARAMRLLLWCISLGYYYGRLEAAFLACMDLEMKSYNAKTKAGPAGGQAKTAKAQATHVEILAAYAEWARSRTSARKSTMAFATWFSKKNQHKRGFGKSTIQAVVRLLEARIRKHRPGKRAGVPKSRLLQEATVAICKTLAEQPGVNEHTVRRALK